MSLRSIFLTALVALGVWYWLRSRELKDFALRAAAKYCDQLSLKLLDQTVALNSLKWTEGSNGKRLSLIHI